MVAQERRSRRAAARLEQRQMASAEDAAMKASPARGPTAVCEECAESAALAPLPKGAEAEALDPQSRLSQVPSPARRRRTASAKGPAPWASSPDGPASQAAGPSYRDQLRNSGHNALQRTREHGPAPKSGGDVTPSPVTVELLPFLKDTKPSPAALAAPASAGRPQAYSMPPFQQQAPMQGYYLQPVYFQPACYVAQAPVVAGCPAGSAATSMFAQRDNMTAGTVGGPSPAAFDMNSEQLEEMLRQAREDVYED